MSTKILIVDDEADIRNLIQAILRDEGYTTLSASSAKEAYQQITTEHPDVVVLDIWLQGSHQDGLEILKNIKTQSPHTQVIMISGHGTIETAVKAIKDGAYDFIEKPFKSDRLILMIRRAIETMRLLRENAQLRHDLGPAPQLTGTSKAIRNLERALREAATAHRNIHLSGPPGSGKELAVRFFSHRTSGTSEGLITLSTRQIGPDDLGKILSRAGACVVFLDDLAALSPECCAVLLRALTPEKQNAAQAIPNRFKGRFAFTSLWAPSEIARISAEHSRVLGAANAVHIPIPSLKERAEDIPALVDVFLTTLGEQLGFTPPIFTAEAMACLKDYTWPGNTRQLKAVVESTVLGVAHTHEKQCGIDDLPALIRPSSAAPSMPESTPRALDVRSVSDLSLREAREIFECTYLLSQIERFGGNISKTAQFVGMERSALHRKIKGLTAEEGRGPRIMTASDSKISSELQTPPEEKPRKQA